ncbi:hypothetical protein ALC56_06329 [Trachymyrmex septentrionalis]|uniref:DNA-directed DNA polymerase n=1 Tax=Trachymyrmex septentrionalis TaxID=34720 RepID=A0A151JX72_9HYME|nr:hypothetical protein ALC56_06329 [Trachymyrmex septentrionalis]
MSTSTPKRNYNLNYRDSYCIPVVFHNLSGYNAYFVIKEIVTAYKRHVDLLPITKEKSRLLTYKLSFLKKELNNKLRILQHEFSNLSEENFNLSTQKGVLPYEYIDCIRKLEELCLPPRKSFYSSFTRFSIRTLDEYSDLYLKTNILLLADVFKNFRDNCIGSYGFLIMFIERGIREGLNQYLNRYVRVNNKYMPSYDPSKPSSYLMYYEVTCHGLRITKVHRILQFVQSPWLRDYIELNTKFRTVVKNDFDKNLYKLMNNAVFGKTMENVRDRVDVKLLHKISGYVHVFDISKTYLYEFHHLECNDVYDIKRDINRFDTSDYSSVREVKKHTKKAKGVKSNVVARSITFSPHDDKRYIVSGSTDTLPWKHYRCK